MRFICGPNRELLKGAPGNYECGKKYRLPYRHSKFKFWELIEDVPLLKVRAVSDEESVFEEAIFLPEEEETESYDEAVIEMSPSAFPEEEMDLDGPAKIEPYMKLNLSTGELSPVSGEPEEVGVVEDAPSVEEGGSPADESNRDELKRVLDEASVEYNENAWTKTLQALVDELEPEE